MQVVIEARALALASGGIRTYVQELVAALQRQSKQHEFITVGTDRKPGPLLGAWLNGVLPKVISEHQPDVVHFTKAAVPRQVSWPTVVTIYDVIPLLFPQSQKIGRAGYWRRTLAHAAHAADRIITISEASKRDIASFLDVDPQKITVTPLAANLNRFQPHSETAPTPYILFVGTLEPRKNVAGLLRAFAQISNDIPHELIFVGKPHKGYRSLLKLANQLGITSRVRWENRVADSDLPRFYALADVLVFPSIYEGWGLPAQEAMASGTPVIVSDGGSLPEVVGEAGIVVPYSTDTISERLGDTVFEQNLASSIGKLLGDRVAQHELKAAGLSRVQEMTWDRVANQTIRVYESLR